MSGIIYLQLEKKVSSPSVIQSEDAHSITAFLCASLKSSKLVTVLSFRALTESQSPIFRVNLVKGIDSI